MRVRNLDAGDGKHSFDRFLDRLLGMEADDIVLLLGICGEGPGCTQV